MAKKDKFGVFSSNEKNRNLFSGQLYGGGLSKNVF